MAPLRISNLWLAPMSDVTTIDINHIYRDSKLSFFSWKIVVIYNNCKWQKSFFCIDLSKYRLITNLGILCLWSLSPWHHHYGNQSTLFDFVVRADNHVISAIVCQRSETATGQQTDGPRSECRCSASDTTARHGKLSTSWTGGAYSSSIYVCRLAELSPAA